MLGPHWLHTQPTNNMFQWQRQDLRNSQTIQTVNASLSNVFLPKRTIFETFVRIYWIPKKGSIFFKEPLLVL